MYFFIKVVFSLLASVGKNILGNNTIYFFQSILKSKKEIFDFKPEQRR